MNRAGGDEDNVILLDDDDEAEAEEVPPEQEDTSQEQETEQTNPGYENLDIDDETWFDCLSPEEKRHHEEHLLTEKDLEESSIVCTSCFRQINHKQIGAVYRHPHLGVTVCKQCRNFYYQGDWTKDGEGYFEFCRWCANGGELLCCDKCKNVFCKKCIKRNLGRNKVTEIDDKDTWSCLMCDQTQIWRQRSMFVSLWKYQKLLKEEVNNDSVEGAGGSMAKKTFIDDALKDSAGVNKIFEDYIEKAKSMWRKKGEDRKDQDYVKMVRKIRTIVKITQHNLKLLDANLMAEFKAEFPRQSEDNVRVDIPETEASPMKENKVIKKEDLKEKKPKKSPDESQDMFDESGPEPDPCNSHLEASSTTVMNANQKAREAVLQTTSSDCDTNLLQNDPEVSPRKKLKTKKELDDLRRKSHVDSKTDDDQEEEGERSSDISLSEDSDSPKLKKASRKLKELLRGQKQTWSRLNAMAASVDITSNRKLHIKSRVEIQDMENSVLARLKEKEKVDVTEFACLRDQVAKIDKDDRDIARLCDLKSLIRRRGSSEYDSRQNGETSKSYKSKKKPKQLGLADISSNSDINSLDQSSEDDQFQGFQRENDLAKSAVLTISSDENPVNDSDQSSDEDLVSSQEKSKKKKEKSKLKDTEVTPKKKKKQSALLTMKLSETDSSEEESKRAKRREKMMESKSAIDNSDTPDDDLELARGSKKKKSKPQRAILSSEDENGVEITSEDNDDGSNYEEDEGDSDDSSDSPKKKKRKKGTSSSDDSESDKPKKRKRIQGGNSDSEEDNDEEASPNKGRHDIRKIIKDKHLTMGTKEAAAEERERRKRIEERQSAYNKKFSIPEGDKEGSVDQLVLDFEPESMNVLVEVNKRLVKKLKPHQIGGVKFMWDACFESLEQINSGKVPGGAILAHCMGLGKTLQTITLTHTVLDNRKVGVQRVMVICPVNTVKNWHDEYDKWLSGELELDVYEMSKEKDNWSRADRINQWFREGGVLIIGYEMFRNLVNEKNNKFKKKQRDIFNTCLLDPGPDLVVCDEGHLLKNEKSAINKAVNRIATRRRIVLTGTPLQNNLKEYFEMVNFVKPLLLGTRKEFSNRFVNPIVNGQHADSTERDVRIMRKRSFVLNDLLKGCMQRLDYNVLVPYLQPKHEYVLSIAMTDLQKKLYKHYLENFAKAGQISDEGKLEGGKKGGLFYDVQQLSRIWNHPFILELAKQRKDEKEADDDDEEGSMKDFICDDDEEDSGNNDSDNDSDIQEVDSNGDALEKKSITRSSIDDSSGSCSKSWWTNFMSENDQLDDIHFGNKMVLLLDILKECALIGDKVLVFSQSLLSLDLIEEFLARVNEAHESSQGSADSSMTEYLDSWLPGKDYYRMDGSTAPDTRKVWCKYFNRPTNYRMRLFLISTKAGGLGINLVAANRVIVFDASWNPSHDIQSIFRVFRFGQTKPVYIYRFLGKGTMEEKIYERQVTKQSLSARVVDEQQIERHFTMNELAELYEFKDEPLSERPTPVVPEDRLLAELLDKHKTVIWSVSNHDSLLENQVDQNLTEDERKSAWEEYEQEKKGVIQTNIGIENTQHFGEMIKNMLPRSGDGRIMASPINPMAIQQQLRQMNPELSYEELVQRTRAAILQLQNLHRVQTPVILNESTMSVGQRNTTGYDQSYYQAEMAKAKAMINQQYPGMYRFGFRGPTPQGPGVATQGRPGPSDVITLDGPADPPMMRMPVRAPVPAPRGGGRGRGGRRGRPRLDPDTDLDFSPEPSSVNNDVLLARLQQAGLNIANNSKPSNGNES